MKKISLAMIAAAIGFNGAVSAESNFGGFRASVLGDWAFVTVTEKGTGAVDPAKDTEKTDRVVKNNGFGKIALDLGYTKVMTNNLLVGASIMGGMDFTKITGAEDKADAEFAKTNEQLAKGDVLAGSYGGAVNVTIGYVVMPKVAVRAIGEVSYFQNKLTTEKDLVGTEKDATTWNLGFGVGGAVDVAVTDRIVLTLGGKYNLAPTDVTYAKKDNDKVLKTDDRKFSNSASWNIFAGLGFRITQD